MEKLSGDLDKWTMLFKKAVIADMADSHNQLKHEYNTKMTEFEREHLLKLKDVQDKLQNLNNINLELQAKADLKNEFLENAASILCKAAYSKLKHKYYSVWAIKFQSSSILKLKEQTTSVIYERHLKRRVLEGWKGQIEQSKEKVFEKRVKAKHDKEIHELRQRYETDIIDVIPTHIASTASCFSHTPVECCSTI
eukprot:NODE_206_length_12919_cov_0.381357.p7 type:complete len:195 gc:universal NODE_206_length_12919_cov_0.381357:11871-11287(-)